MGHCALPIRMASEALGSATPTEIDDDVRKAVHSVSGEARRKYLGIPDDITAKLVAWDLRRQSASSRSSLASSVLSS